MTSVHIIWLSICKCRHNGICKAAHNLNQDEDTIFCNRKVSCAYWRVVLVFSVIALIRFLVHITPDGYFNNNVVYVLVMRMMENGEICCCRFSISNQYRWKLIDPYQKTDIVVLMHWCCVIETSGIQCDWRKWETNILSGRTSFEACGQMNKCNLSIESIQS